MKSGKSKAGFKPASFSKEFLLRYNLLATWNMKGNRCEIYLSVYRAVGLVIGYQLYKVNT